MESFRLPRPSSSRSKCTNRNNTCYYQRLDNYENDSVPLLYETSTSTDKDLTPNKTTKPDVIGMYQDGTILYDNACVLDVSTYLNYRHKYHKNYQRKRRTEKSIGPYDVSQVHRQHSLSWKHQLIYLRCCSNTKSNDREKLFSNHNNIVTDTNQPFTFDFSTIDNISTTFDHSSISSHASFYEDDDVTPDLETQQQDEQAPEPEQKEEHEDDDDELQLQRSEQQFPLNESNAIEPPIQQQPITNDFITRTDGTNLEDSFSILPIGYVTVVKNDNNYNKNISDNEKKYKSYFENDDDNDEEEYYDEVDNKKIDYYESFHTSLTSYNTTVSSATSSTHSHSSSSSSDSSTSCSSSTNGSNSNTNDSKENYPVGTNLKKKVGWLDETKATRSPPPLHSGISSLPTRYTPLVTKILVTKKRNNLQSVRIDL